MGQRVASAWRPPAAAGALTLRGSATTEATGIVLFQRGSDILLAGQDSGRLRLGLDFDGDRIMTTAHAQAQLLADLEAIFRDSTVENIPGPMRARPGSLPSLGLASIDAVVLGETLDDRYGRKLPFGEMMAELGSREIATSNSARSSIS